MTTSMLRTIGVGLLGLTCELFARRAEKQAED